MSTAAVATLQTAWDCRWSQPGYRLRGVTDRPQPESLWVCVRTGWRTPISEADCETCPYWEYQESPAIKTDTALRSGERELNATAFLPRVWTRAAWINPRIRLAALRAVLIANAAVLAFVGFAILTRPLFIPLTMATWFGAVAMVAFAIWGHGPSDATPNQRAHP